MSSTLLVVERLVLESLERKQLTVNDLKIQTGFSPSLLNGILHLLISKGIVKRDDHHYEINWAHKDNWLSIVKNKDGMKAELKELFSAMIDQREVENNQGLLKVQKIWLEPFEKQELKEKWKDIESYLARIREKRKRRPVREKTIGRQVLFFGFSPYESLIDGIIKSA